MKGPIWKILGVALAVRLFMVFFGSRVLDAADSELNYTDIDYNIFTDAAQLILNGKLLCFRLNDNLSSNIATLINVQMTLFLIHLLFPFARFRSISL